MKRIISYAQNREDVILSAFFSNKKEGFYVDIGANDPNRDSVTKYFYDLGWTGMNIEPNNRLYKRLKKYRPKDLNINMGISDKRGKLLFREYKGDGLSTFSENEKILLVNESNPLAKDFKDYMVDTERLDNLFSMYNIEKIDFMKIDVEGFEYEVLSSNNWNLYRPKVICIESNHIFKDWKSLLDINKYRMVFNDGLNDYYVDSYEDIKFDYINEVIGREIVPSKLNIELNDLESQIRQSDMQIKFMQKKINLLTDENRFLVLEREENERFRNIVKKLLHKFDNIIIIRISNFSKMKRFYPDIKIKLADEDPFSLLKKIHEADKVAYNSKITFPMKINRSVSNGILIIYTMLKKLVKIAISKFIRLVGNIL
jgi:FkbM family methyltransferase